MPSALSIRNIGDARKVAIEAEAKRRGVSLSELVRSCIDSELDRSRADRERAQWVKEARAGLFDEAQHLEKHGPSLARYRRAGVSDT